MNLPPAPGIVVPVTMHHNVVGYQQHGQLIFVRSPITNQGQPVIFQNMQVNPTASVSSCQGQGHFSPVSGGITNISHFPIVTNYSVPTSNRFQSLQEWNENFPPLPSSENSEEEMRAVNPLEAEGVISEANTDNPTKTGMKRRDVSPVSEYLNQPQNKNLKRKLNEVQSSINQNPAMLNKKSVEMPYNFRVPASRVYSTVKSLISGSREDQRNPPITYKNSTLVTDQEIAEAPVSLLDSVIGVPDPLSDCEVEVKAKVKRFSKSYRSVAYNQPFLTQEIEKVINHLPLTALEEDMIFPQFVKALPKNWVAALLNIINELWNEGQFPKIWKDGVVVLIPKVGKDKSKLQNYRTITLLPGLGKVYERLVKQRMNQVIELNRELKNIQCGFRRNRNTEDVMLMFINDAVYALENKKVLLMTFLDVVSAFESMVHRHILEAIMAAAVKGQLLEFSDSFLEGREVKIKVGKSHDLKEMVSNMGS
ncbi:hypothetical protein QYM36_007604 [Artemia franciscana]|uniref:Reverse transcriptase domain-containing protein n=1 Tax=Artemia franciscana TaxID=6661 RepID=A0AA88IU65_ARTSF|nr:hypothetical protein QYM36_007604 [Artemia franciscana]